jgi:hypothetical protein
VLLELLDNTIHFWYIWGYIMASSGRAIDELEDLTTRMSKMKGLSMAGSFVIEGEEPGDGREQLAA